MRRSLIAVLALIPAVAAMAEDPNQHRGFSPDKVYMLGGIDAINPFNGNLTLTIPLGPTYTVSPTLSYQFMLTYNSTVWDYEYVTTEDPEVPDRRAIPERHSNAGLGWNITLGRLIEPLAPTSATPGHGWLYLAPDGSSHEFFGTTTAAPTATEGFSYTRDGSYLRRREGVPGAGAQHTVDFPDGTRRFFNTAGDLLRIEDRFGNWVKIDYTSIPGRWKIEDGFGSTVARTHYMDIVTGWYYPPTSGYGSYTQLNLNTRVGGLDLQGFGGVRATYGLTYEHVDVGRGGCAQGIPGDAATVRVPLLRTIAFPTVNNQPAETYEAEYYTSGHCGSGAIRGLEFPTLGWLRWSYGQAYELPVENCHMEDHWLAAYLGVTKREVLTKAQGINALPDPVEIPTWTYAPSLSGESGIALQPCTTPEGIKQYQMPKPPQEFKNTITGPDGTATIHYFSVYPKAGQTAYAGPFKGREYGLPFTRNSMHGGRGLSREVKNSGGALEEQVYAMYETDGTADDGGGSNSREQARRTVYPLDSGCTANAVCYTDVDRADYDGYGHYRATTESSNYPQTPSRSTAMTYNVGACRDGQNGPCQNGTGDGTPYFGTNEEWLLNMFTESTTTSNGTTVAKSIPTFHSVTSVMTNNRTLVSASPGPGDVLTAWCRDTRGFVTSERFFGGDNQTVPTTDFCSTAPRAGEYAINHAFTSQGTDGPRTRRDTAYLSGTGTVLPGTMTSEEYDTSTGLTRTTIDSAGVQTAYTYDTAARLAQISPTGTAATTYTYETATASTPARVTVAQTSGTAGTVRTAYEYDDHGRLRYERIDMPNGAPQTVKQTEYDKNGRKSKTWEPYAAGTPLGSWTYMYDALGRTIQITQPDNKTTTMTHTGGREVTRAVSVGDGVNNTVSPATTTETYDGFGRLIAVAQQPCSICPVTATYAYDAFDRLTNAAVAGQPRSFTYDWRGFLLAETHPENGETRYERRIDNSVPRGGYDARGHQLGKKVGTTDSVFDLDFVYDRAERLARVDARNPYAPGTFRTVKEFSFGTANTIDNLVAGKVSQAVRHNYQPALGDVIVVEQFEYGDTSGHLTRKTTNVGLGGNTIREFMQAYEYNDLGLIAKLTYPTCQGGAGCGQSQWDAVNTTYSAGLPTSVASAKSGFSPQTYASIAYTPGGMHSTVTHANGVLETREPDATGMQRPKRITFTPWAGCSQATITSPPVATTVTYGASAHLTVAATGTGTKHYQWYLDGALVGADVDYYDTPNLTAPATIRVVVSNSCGQDESAPITVSVKLATPNSLVASRGATGTSFISWSSVSGAQQYEVQRRANAGSYATVMVVAGTTCDDLVSDGAYQYRVRSTRSDSVLPSDYSNVDYVTITSFNETAVGSTIGFSDFDQLLTAINALRTLAGLGTTTWQSIVQAGVPVPEVGGVVYAEHLNALRREMDAALGLLGGPAGGFTDPDVTLLPIRAIHIQQLRDRTN
jgi:YD repeat-containing protein